MSTPFEPLTFARDASAEGDKNDEHDNKLLLRYRAQLAGDTPLDADSVAGTLGCASSYSSNCTRQSKELLLMDAWRQLKLWEAVKPTQPHAVLEIALNLACVLRNWGYVNDAARLIEQLENVAQATRRRQDEIDASARAGLPAFSMGTRCTLCLADSDREDDSEDEEEDKDEPDDPDRLVCNCFMVMGSPGERPPRAWYIYPSYGYLLRMYASMRAAREGDGGRWTVTVVQSKSTPL